MLNDIHPDVVFISTNWDNHAPMAIESMQNGSHCFVEVPLAVTIDDLWKIVNVSEKLVFFERPGPTKHHLRKDRCTKRYDYNRSLGI